MGIKNFLSYSCLWGALFTFNACGGSTRDNSTTSLSTGGSSSHLGGSGGGGQVGNATGGNAADAGKVLVPVDTRPEPPAWQPDIPLGTAGWQQSTTTYCDTHQGVEMGYDLWGDHRGVFALVSSECSPSGDIVVCRGNEGWGLQFNDGTGWKWLFGDTAGRAMPSLSGFPDGPAILLGYSQSNIGSESVTFLEGGAPTFSAAVAAQGESVFRAFGLGPTHAYFLATSGLGTQVKEYRDGNLSVAGSFASYQTAIWADENTIVVVGAEQSIYMRTTGSSDFALVPSVPAGDYTSVWGFGSNDLWVGNTIGQLLHYNGSSWQTVNSNTTNAIGAIWGVDGELFFTTQSEFGHWNGNTAEILIASQAKLGMMKLWGLSSKEVFLAVDDASFADYKCGDHFLVWFDGSAFHQF